jgi:hypothetical protein
MITELEKKILGAEISSADDWIDNIKTCGLFVEKEEEVVRSRVKVCLLDLRKDWEAVLVEKNISIPADDYEFAELVFAQSDYKSQSQKEIKSLNELLIGEQGEKTRQLEIAYTNAQFILVTNGHSFYIPLKGYFYNVTLTQKLSAAAINGQASLSAIDTNGDKRTLNNIPYSEWLKFSKKADPISFSNWNLKDLKIIEIDNCTTMEELNLVNLDIFPAIEEVLINI